MIKEPILLRLVQTSGSPQSTDQKVVPDPVLVKTLLQLLQKNTERLPSAIAPYYLPSQESPAPVPASPPSPSALRRSVSAYSPPVALISDPHVSAQLKIASVEAYYSRNMRLSPSKLIPKFEDIVSLFPQHYRPMPPALFQA